MKKKLSALIIMFTMFAIPAAASAHVVVKPAEVKVGEFQTFTTGVPTEDDSATVVLRLVIPAGLREVSPNVKPGWTINEKTVGGGETATVTEISWTGGSIPSGQRDDFAFAAQAPAKQTSLHWKAYQTLADGSVESWDQTPSGKDDEATKPYSITTVVDDLSDMASSSTSNRTDATSVIALALAIVAIIVSGVTLLSRRNR